MCGGWEGVGDWVGVSDGGIKFRTKKPMLSLKVKLAVRNIYIKYIIV